MEAILFGIIIVLIGVILLIRAEVKEKKYITYIRTENPDEAWTCYKTRIEINPGMDKYELARIDGKYVVRKEI